MNTKAIALFAVLAVALTGGFAIAGADAADGDDFAAEYWTEGPFEGVDATFETGLATQLTWWASLYGSEGAIADHAIVTVSGKLASFMWNSVPLEAGTYQVEIYNTAKTIVYEGSVVVPQTYTVTFAVDDSVVKTLPVDDGDYIAADQLPEDPVKGGQDFVGWALEGATVAFDFANTPITQDYDFKALFKPKEYTITVDPAIQNGTVTPSKAVATMGETIALTVTPAEGYQTVSVTVDGVAIEGNTFEMPAKDVTVSATFEAKEYTITVDPEIQNGTVVADKEKATAGQTVTLTVTPAEGYQTVSVTVDGTAIEGNTFEMPAKDVTVSATFDLMEYTITVDPEIQNGTVTPSKLKAKAGEAISLTVLPAEGYQVASVTLDGVALEEYAFTMPAKDVTVSATFEAKEYTITVDPAIVNGTVVSDKEKAKAGETVTLTVTADEGYQIASVTVDGKEIEESSFTMPNKNVTVSATFELQDYAIAIDPAIVNGTVTADKEKAKAGETVTLTVTADEGYQIASVTVDGKEIEESSFTMPAKDVTVSATFELIPEPEYTITIDPEIRNGTVTADKEKAKAGETVTLTVTPAEGFIAAAVTVNGETIEGASFEMPASDVIVSAAFIEIPIIEKHAIAVDTEMVGGDVTPDKYLVAAGATVTLSYTEDEGYTFVSYYAYTRSTETPITVSDDGTFTMPADDVIVGAIFLPDVPVEKYTVTVLPSENGTASADVTEAEEGDLITITATPDDGYQTAAIYVDGKPLLEGENTFFMPAKDVEVSAVFAEIPVGGCTVTYVDVNGFVETESYEIGEEVVYHVKTVPEGMKLGYVDFEPWMAFLIYQEECIVTFTAVEGNYTAMISYIAPYTVTILDQGGKFINDFQYFAEDPVELDVGYTLGVEVESATSEPEIDDFNCEDGVITFTMPAQDVTVTVTLKPIVPVFYDAIVKLDGEVIKDGQFVEGADVVYDLNEYILTGVTASVTGPEGLEYDFEEGVLSFEMPAADVEFTLVLKPIVPVEKHTVTYVDQDGNAIGDAEEHEAGEPVFFNVPERAGADVVDVTSEPEVADFVYIRGLVTFTMPEYDVTVIVTYEPFVAPVSVTFMDGETVIDTVFVEIGGFVEEVPEAPVKEGFNFVGWCVNDIPTAIDFDTTPIFDDMTVYATYIETPDIGEGFAILYHDMYKGKPVDIWWKGYASKDDRVMLANGMDATAIFMGWLAEDQETLFSWNAAYDLNDIERNDCLIYPASYGYPGTDRIYELNAIYALQIEWVSFDGETVLKTDEVIRGEYLEAPFDDEEMQDMLDDYKPSDEGYSYTWAGWNVPGVGTYTSEDVEYIKANGSWRIVATYEGKVNEYDITFIWHDGTSTIRVPYGEVPEIENPPAYEDDDFTYTFAGWDPEVKKVDGDATYIAMYDKTSKTKDVTITVNDPVRGYFTYGDEELTEKVIEVPMDFDVADIDEDVLTFELLFYLLDIEIPETLVFTAVPNDDDFEANKHFEFVKWNVSEDGLTYTAEFSEDIITSKDLDRIQTFFDYTKTEGGDVVFTLKSKDGLAIPKGTMTVWYYEIAYLEDIEDWVQIERSCDAIAMDWDEETYGDNLISMTIEYADLTQDGEAFDITSKTISTMWLVFDGVNGAHCESNKATPGQ